MEQITFDEIPEPDVDLKYRRIDHKLVTYIERIVRNLYEYTYLVYFIKNFLDINKCTFYKNYNITSGFTIELHHSPLTLYDITDIVVKREFEKNGYIESFIVADLIIEYHYKFMVGLVPLSPTAHELVHSGNLMIHKDLVIGNWEKFIVENKEWVNSTILNKINTLKELSSKHDFNEFPKLLKYSPTKINVKGQRSLLTYDAKKLIIDKKVKLINKA